MRKILAMLAVIMLAMHASAYSATMPYTPKNEGMSLGFDAVRGIDSQTTVYTLYGHTSGSAAYTTNEAGFGNTGGAILWDGDSAMTEQSSGFAAEFTSGDTADSENGPGVRTILVTGIDTSYDVQSETVTLDGTTGASTTNRDYLVIESVVAQTAGGSGANEGAITGRETSGGDRVAVIDAGVCKTRQAFTYCPDGYDDYIQSVSVGIDDTADCVIRIEKKPYGGVWQEVARVYVYAGQRTVVFDNPIHIDEKEGLRIRGMLASDATSDVTASAQVIRVSE